MNQIQTHSTDVAIDGCNTITKLWRKNCLERGARIAHREKDLGIWQSYTWHDYYHKASAIGAALLALGLQRGEVVSILSEDNKEWLYCDMGICAAGGISNGIYTTDSASQLAYLVKDSGSTFLFVENDEQLDKYLAVSDELTELRKVIVFDRKGLRDFSHPRVMFLDELYALGDTNDTEHIIANAIAKSQPDDIRMLIYTSGTTGAPKGAMISHRNILSQLLAVEEMLDVKPTDEQLCFLPLCHILERLISVEIPNQQGSTVNFAESPETIFDNLREVSPHTFTAVPRLWEKMYSSLRNMRTDATAVGRWAFDKAVAAGHEYRRTETPSAVVRLRYQFWNLLVLRNVREFIGMGRIRRATTGAAPISPELIRWFQAIGVPLFEGYGMTESTGVISLNTHARQQIGSVGCPIPGSEVRISEHGEILIRGGHVFAGYWKKPEKTAEDVRDGWLHTGDTGRIEDGMLTITGRIKDIIITAGGKNITPAEIESRLKFSQYISDAVVIGDQRKYLTCLIMIDQENVEKYAQDLQVAFSDFASLCRAAEVLELIDSIVQDTNKVFAQVEQIKYFRLIDVLLTAEDEELTATMKLKRSLVEKKHKHLIDSMYPSS
jgi:long-chain acyl-CoA synthetase